MAILTPDEEAKAKAISESQQKLNEELSYPNRRTLWELIHEYLPLSTTFVEIVP